MLSEAIPSTNLKIFQKSYFDLEIKKNYTYLCITIKDQNIQF